MLYSYCSLPFNTIEKDNCSTNGLQLRWEAQTLHTHCCHPVPRLVPPNVKLHPIWRELSFPAVLLSFAESLTGLAHKQWIQYIRGMLVPLEHGV